MNMKKPKLLLALKISSAIVALLLIMGGTAGLFRARMSPDKLEVKQGIPLPESGQVITVRRENIPDQISLSGTVHSERQINLSARLPAYVEAVHVNAGDRVPEGKLLLALDQRELREELAAAQASLQQAESAFRRSERLLETNATTPQAHEAAESQYRTAQAQTERVNIMLTYTRIMAPIDGVVKDRFVEVGDLAAMGQPLLTIFDPSHLRIEVPVPASLIHLFPVDAAFSVILDQKTITYTGTVTEIVSAFDPVTRTRRVKLHLADTDEHILPGMYGHVTVPTGEISTILLPPQAIDRVGQLESVMIVVDDHLQRRLIRTGPTHNGKIRILSGLNEGDEIWIPEDARDLTEGA